jgi:hypothetical protein
MAMIQRMTNQKVAIRVVEPGLDILQHALVAIEVHNTRDAASQCDGLHGALDFVKETVHIISLCNRGDELAYTVNFSILHNINGGIIEQSGTASATTSRISFVRRAMAWASDLQCFAR